jgi:ribosomal protein L11 methyltransferase
MPPLALPPLAVPTLALRFRAPIALEDVLQGFMLTHAIVAGIEEADGELTYYVPSSEWDGSHEHALHNFLEGAPGIRFLGTEIIEDRDWNAEWEASVQPEHVTPHLVITPSWHKDAALAMGAEHLIAIDPKMSFGTGHHETTRLCLRALETMDCAGRTVLDLGTGTGVLAIYALLRGAQRAVGVDTDPWSIKNAEENRTLNHLTPEQFEIRAGTLQEAANGGEMFDIILANIHRNVLIELAPEIRKHASNGANLILAGLLTYDVDEVQQAYEHAGFECTSKSEENEWASLIFLIPHS